jgi:hypothetical protein
MLKPQNQEREPSKKVGDLLVIWITGMTGQYIAEVIQENPLRVKVMETGPFTDLREYGDFGVMKPESLKIQDKDRKIVNEFLEEQIDADRPLISGLARFGVTDEGLYTIIPSNEGEDKNKEEVKEEN